jgi:putative sterol carrier protein
LKPQQAFMKGKLKIKGKMNLAMKLTSVLVATRKKLPASKM